MIEEKNYAINFNQNRVRRDEKNDENRLETLPFEIICLIFEKLDRNSQLQLTLVNRSIKRLVSEYAFELGGPLLLRHSSIPVFIFGKARAGFELLYPASLKEFKENLEKESPESVSKKLEVFFEDRFQKKMFSHLVKECLTDGPAQPLFFLELLRKVSSSEKPENFSRYVDQYEELIQQGSDYNFLQPHIDFLKLLSLQENQEAVKKFLEGKEPLLSVYREFFPKEDCPEGYDPVHYETQKELEKGAEKIREKGLSPLYLDLEQLSENSLETVQEEIGKRNYFGLVAEIIHKRGYNHEKRARLLDLIRFKSISREELLQVIELSYCDLKKLVETTKEQDWESSEEAETTS